MDSDWEHAVAPDGRFLKMTAGTGQSPSRAITVVLDWMQDVLAWQTVD